MPDAPFMPIRHTITGEITTTGYNAAARRILLQDGFEETPGCACRATEPGTERTHGPARQPASCSSPGHPLPLDRALGRPVSADGTPRLARSPMSGQSVIRSETDQPLQPTPTPPAALPVEGASR